MKMSLGYRIDWVGWTKMPVEYVFECPTCGSKAYLPNYPVASPSCQTCRKMLIHITEQFDTEKEKEEFIEESKTSYGYSYDAVTNILRYYMDLPESHIKLIALWICSTWLHKAFPSFPFLYFTAMKGSGKTRLLKIISHLAYGGKGQVHTGITDSVLFRMPKHATLVLDECESISSKEKSTLREYMNACYKSGGVVQRSKKTRTKDGSEGYEIESFEPYKPIAMANIWGMDEVLGDRTLTLVLEKSNNPSKTKLIEDFTSNPSFLAIKSSFNQYLCSLCNVVTSLEHITRWNNYVSNKYNHSINTHNTYISITTLNYNYIRPSQEDDKLMSIFRKIDSLGIEGRNLELMFPLLITSSILSESLFLEMCEIARDLAIQKKEDDFMESRDISLIDFVVQRNYGLARVSVSELTREFRDYLGNIDEEDRWLNSKWCGRALKRLGLILEKKRVTKGQQVILNNAKAKQKLLMFRTPEEITSKEEILFKPQELILEVTKDG